MNGNRAKILGVSLNSTSADSVLNTIVELAMTQGGGNKPTMVFTPNPEFLVEAQKDKDFQDLLNRSDINLVDGFGLILAGKILKRKVGERISGADMVESILRTANSLQLTADIGKQSAISDKPKSWTIGVAGARGGILSESKELIKNLREKYPNITFINLDDPNLQFTIYNLQSNQKFQISNFKFQIVLACHGMKKQEKWIWENASFAKASEGAVKANVFMGVGGSLDFLTGFSRRAPPIIRRIGFEWLWRGLHKPRHFKRIWKATALFGWMVLKEKLSLVLGLNSEQP